MDELKPYTFNVKAWQVRNGYTTPEWVMYRNNRRFYALLAGALFFCAGVQVGAMICYYGGGL